MGVTVAGDVVTAGGVVSVFQGKDGQNNDDLKDGTLLNKWYCYCQQCYGAGAAIFLKSSGADYLVGRS